MRRSFLVVMALVVVTASACGGATGSQGAATAPGSSALPATSAPTSDAPGSTASASSVPGTEAPTTSSSLATSTTTAPPTTRALPPPSSAPAPTAAPVTAAPPTTVAHADQFSFEECGHDSVADPQAVANSVGVPGSPVALISDSIGSQVRFGLIAGYQHHWVVWARCGASVDDALQAGAAGTLARFHPTVVVVALGTNDAGYPNPSPGASAGFGAHAAQLLDQIGPGPCVVWVDVAQVGDPALQNELNTINRGINALPVRGVRVARWSDVVATDPAVLIDRVHLSHHGVERRIKLLDDAVNACVKK